MHVAPKIHPADFPRISFRLNTSPNVLPHQLIRLAQNVIHNLPFIDDKSMTLLKDLSLKIEAQYAKYKDSHEPQDQDTNSDRLCFRINQLVPSVFSIMEILYIPHYPNGIIKIIANQTALEMLYQEIDKLGDTTLQLQTIQEKLDVLNIERENFLYSSHTKSIDSFLKKQAELMHQRYKYHKIGDRATYNLIFLACKSGNFLRELALPIDLSKEEIRIILAKCPNIEKINLRQGGCEEVPLGKISLLKHLKILELPYHTPLHDFDFNTLPRVEELSLDCRNQDFLNLSQLVKLKKLHLTVDHDDLLNIISQNHEIFTHLEDLNLEINKSMWESIWDSQNGSLQYLTEMAKITTLKKLSITSLLYAQNYLSDNALHVLASCQTLETLHFDRVEYITQEGVEHLVSSLPKLKTLSLEFSVEPEVDFEKLQTKFPALVLKILLDYSINF